MEQREDWRYQDNEGESEMLEGMGFFETIGAVVFVLILFAVGWVINLFRK